MKVSILFGSGIGRHYELGFLSGFSSKSLFIDIIGGTNAIKDSKILKNQNFNYYNFFDKIYNNTNIWSKVIIIIKYYIKLIKYALNTDSKIFHIQWFNKVYIFDRTILNILYKIFGKKLVFTAHNIVPHTFHTGRKSYIERLSITFMYKIVDHLIVHTDKMKRQLIEEFKIKGEKITVIPHGILNSASKTNLSENMAKKKLKLNTSLKTILFFGNIAPYKGLEYLIKAIAVLKSKYNDFRLIIAGEVKKECIQYWKNIEEMIDYYNIRNNLLIKPVLIPDEEVEVFFKAADILILPYVDIFQSGVLFLSFYFGLPVIATNVGSLKEDIIEGESGYICKSKDPDDMAKTIETYFKNDLYKNLKENRKKIINYANKKYSWNNIGTRTYKLYENLLV
jgi:D-inositol-3-phosphate glycosyltransferase